MCDVSVRQYSQELSVSSVMIPILSRSGYVTALLPPYFKQSFHEFCYWRLRDMRCESLVGMFFFLCTSVLTILEVCLVCKLVGIVFGLGVW